MLKSKPACKCTASSINTPIIQQRQFTTTQYIHVVYGSGVPSLETVPAFTISVCALQERVHQLSP